MKSKTSGKAYKSWLDLQFFPVIQRGHGVRVSLGFRSFNLNSLLPQFALLVFSRKIISVGGSLVIGRIGLKKLQ
jgi:hypothetical protein